MRRVVGNRQWMVLKAAGSPSDDSRARVVATLRHRGLVADDLSAKLQGAILLRRRTITKTGAEQPGEDPDEFDIIDAERSDTFDLGLALTAHLVDEGL